MEWTDYREKLGIGFNDKEKAKMLIIKLCNYIEYKLCNNITQENREDYFIMICEPPRYDHRPYASIINSICQSKSSKEALSKYIAFCNTYKWHGTETSGTREAKKFLLDSLDSLGLGYEIITDNDGMFVFSPIRSQEDLSKAYENGETIKIVSVIRQNSDAEGEGD